MGDRAAFSCSAYVEVSEGGSHRECSAGAEVCRGQSDGTAIRLRMQWAGQLKDGERAQAVQQE